MGGREEGERGDDRELWDRKRANERETERIEEVCCSVVFIDMSEEIQERIPKPTRR